MTEPSAPAPDTAPALAVLPPARGTTPLPAAVRTVLHAVNAALDVADDVADGIARAIDAARGRGP